HGPTAAAARRATRRPSACARDKDDDAPVYESNQGSEADGGLSYYSPWRSLISSLIHPRTPASIGVHRSFLSRHVDLRGRSCTVIRNPEKRKVGGSTPPLTTTFSGC